MNIQCSNISISVSSEVIIFDGVSGPCAFSVHYSHTLYCRHSLVRVTYPWLGMVINFKNVQRMQQCCLEYILKFEVPTRTKILPTKSICRRRDSTWTVLPGDCLLNTQTQMPETTIDKKNTPNKDTGNVLWNYWITETWAKEDKSDMQDETLLWSRTVIYTSEGWWLRHWIITHDWETTD